MAIILGIDCSSTTVGYAILETASKSIKLLKVDYFKPSKTGDIFDRLSDVKNNISIILKKYKPDHIAIEDISKFMPKKSSANTIITLAVFNRTVGLLCYEYLKKSPILISVMSIRYGLKLTKELPSKEEMPELVSKHLKIKFPYSYKKSGKIKEECYDMSDAIATSLYAAFKLTDKLKQIKTTRDLLL